MKKVINYAHQGDLNFRKVDSIPEGFTLLKEKDLKRGGVTLALGEHSGHAHTLLEQKENQFEVYQDAQGRHCLVFNEDTILLHGTFVAPAKINEEEIDKHDALVFPAKTIFIQDFEEGYDPILKAVQRVMD